MQVNRKRKQQIKKRCVLHRENRVEYICGDLQCKKQFLACKQCLLVDQVKTKHFCDHHSEMRGLDDFVNDMYKLTEQLKEQNLCDISTQLQQTIRGIKNKIDELIRQLNEKLILVRNQMYQELDKIFRENSMLRSSIPQLLKRQDLIDFIVRCTEEEIVQFKSDVNFINKVQLDMKQVCSDIEQKCGTWIIDMRLMLSQLDRINIVNVIDSNGIFSQCNKPRDSNIQLNNVQILVYCPEMANIKMYDIQSMQVSKEIQCVSSNTSSFGVSSGLFAVGNYTKSPYSIDIYSIYTYKYIKTLKGHTQGIYLHTLLFLEDDGKLISGSHDGTIKIWNLSTYEEEDTINLNYTSIYSICRISNTYKVAVSGCSPHSITVIDIYKYNNNNTNNIVLYGHTSYILSIQWCEATQELVSASRDKTLRFWNIYTNQQTKCIQLIEEAQSLLVIEPNTTCIVALVGFINGVICIYDLKNKNLLSTLQYHNHIVNCFDYYQSLDIVASGSYDKHIVIWKLNNKKIIQDIPQLDNHVLGLKFI